MRDLSTCLIVKALQNLMKEMQGSGRHERKVDLIFYNSPHKFSFEMVTFQGEILKYFSTSGFSLYLNNNWRHACPNCKYAFSRKWPVMISWLRINLRVALFKCNIQEGFITP